MLTKKMQNYAKKLATSRKESIAQECDGVYYYSDMFQILQLPEKVEGLEYADKRKTKLLDDVMKDASSYEKDYVAFPINIDLDKAIKTLSGRKRTNEVVWRGGDEYPYLSARRVKEAAQMLKAKRIFINTLNPSKWDSIFMYYEDDPTADIKFLLLPVNRNKDYPWIGVRDVDDQSKGTIPNDFEGERICKY